MSDQNPVPPNPNVPAQPGQPGTPGYQPVGMPPSVPPAPVQNPVGAVGVPAQVGVGVGTPSVVPVVSQAPVAPVKAEKKPSIFRRHSTVFMVIGFGIAIIAGAAVAKLLLFSKETQQTVMHSAANTRPEPAAFEMRSYEPIPIDLEDESIAELINAFAEVKVQAEQDSIKELEIDADKPDWQQWEQDVSIAQSEIVKRQTELSDDLMIAYQLSLEDADAIRRHLDYEGRWSLGASDSLASSYWLYEQGIKHFFAGGIENFEKAYTHLYAASELQLVAAEAPLDIIEPVLSKSAVAAAKVKAKALSDTFGGTDAKPAAPVNPTGSGASRDTAEAISGSGSVISDGSGATISEETDVDAETEEGDSETESADVPTEPDESATEADAPSDEVSTKQTWPKQSLLPASLLSW